MPILKPIQSVETAPLRHKILRPHQALSEMAYPHDDAPGTAHFGAFQEDGSLVGIASIYPESRAGQFGPDSGEWRLRGMAVEPHLQGQGVGRALVKMCLEHVQRSGGRVFWCNARVTALNFYTACGLRIEGPEFEVSGIGPHYVMVREI